MNLQEWKGVVRAVIKQCPNWVAETNNAISEGVQERLREEIHVRANAEAALVICYEAGKENIPSHQVQMVKEAIKNSHLVGGTKYTENL